SWSRATPKGDFSYGPIPARTSARSAEARCHGNGSNSKAFTSWPHLRRASPVLVGPRGRSSLAVSAPKQPHETEGTYDAQATDHDQDRSTAAGEPQADGPPHGDEGGDTKGGDFGARRGHQRGLLGLAGGVVATPLLIFLASE